MSSLSTSLKNSYQKWLLPYEDYLRVAKPGVHQHMEMMNGGPYTPSPGVSPAKRQDFTPLQEETPTMRASAALQTSINGYNSPPRPSTQPPPPPQETSQSLPALPPSSTGGFTPVNAGGFTPVNAAPPATSFTSVNSVNGYSHSSSGTPQMSIETQPTSNGPQQIAPHPNGVAALKRQHSESILTAEEIDAMNRRSKRLRKDVPTVAGSNMHQSRMSGGRPSNARDQPSFRSGEACENCGKADEVSKLLECQSCDCIYHMYCLEPPLKQKPDYEWHCPRCLVGTNEYGFEEGDVYSLAGFQRKASEFKENHFANLPKHYSPFTDTKRHLDEEDVEREFWRLVEDISDATEVEYGADIHSTTHGSGFPTIEKQPRDSYSADPWNLNILPLDKESLFRHIKSDISGMTVPWLYVGMVFSTFCWHNEDHFAYSANYQHFGETKTWYGIPAEDSYKFEQAMRDEVPELFESQPDLLFQLVTLARPEKLRKAGVRVFALDQHAGQFVVTFPRAYHAGFNHGFNFNEAVNFAPHDWEPFGYEGVKRLKEYRKPPCFSHDELLLTAASRDHSIKTAKWLAPALERMRDDELETRKQFFTTSDPESGIAPEEPYVGPRYKGEPEIIDQETEEDETMCTFCKCYCFLSRYHCKKANKTMCLLHAGSFECCDAHDFERYSGQNGDHVLYHRMTNDALNATVRKVADKANIPETWTAKVDNELDDNPRPSLKHLRTLLTEGERIQYELPQLADLRRFVERCNEWVEEATNYITRKQQNRRKNEKAWRKGTAKAAELEERDKALRSVDNIRKLLDSADDISFDCPEIDTLRERAESIADFQRDANTALNNISMKSTADFEEMMERGREFHVDIPEIDNLERVVKRLKWNDLAKQKRPNQETKRQNQTLKDVEKFIAEGLAIGVPENNQDIVFFREHKAQAELWEEKAKELMAVEQVHYQQLDSLSKQATTLPVSAETLAAVDAILRKQREVQDKIATLIENSKNPDFRQRPMYKEMRAVVEALEELQSKPNGTIELEKLQRAHEDWMRKGKKLFGKANAPLHILNQHMQIVEARNENCFDLADKPRMPVEPMSRATTPEHTGPGTVEGSISSRDVFCICRKSEAGMMIECEVCHEWYHGKCLKIARGKVKEEDKYTCPICDWRVKIPRDAARPKLEDLQTWQDDLEGLPFQPEEERTLNNICEQGAAFREFMRTFINPENPSTPEEIGTLRFHLRKIEGADILLAEETNYLRKELHKWAPVAPEPPPPIQVSMSTRKPRPTKQQKLMASLGITNPDDLPQQYKIKPHVAKRKASEAFPRGSGPSPLQLQPSPSSQQYPPQQTPQQQSSTQPTSSAGLGLLTGPNAAAATEKKFLTPLAIQVLGELASAPVVSPVLTSEPHMNSEKLLKMKAILELDPAAGSVSAEEMKKRIAAFVLPAATQGVGFAFDSIIRPNPGSSSTAARLGSPATFDAGRFGGNGGGSPAPHHQQQQRNPHAFDTQMFDSGGAGSGHNMFDSPGHHHQEAKASPDFGAARAFFDAQHGMGMGMQSPGSAGGASQQNIDNVFAELVHDQEMGMGMGGFDGAGEEGVRDRERLAVTAAAAQAAGLLEVGGVAGSEAPAPAALTGESADEARKSSDDIAMPDAAAATTVDEAPPPLEQPTDEREKIVMEDFVHEE